MDEIERYMTKPEQFTARVFNDAGDEKRVLLSAVNEWEAKQAFYARNPGWYVASIGRR